MPIERKVFLLNDSYKYLSMAYDELMLDVDYDKWADYVDYLIKDQEKNALNIYEAGCGTGAISVRLAKKGYKMLCSDISEEMLEKAAQNARNTGVNINFILQDMRKASCSGYRDAVIACCDAVNYLVSNNDLNEFLKSAYNMLCEDGIILFDISSRYKLENIIGDNIFYEDNENTTYFWQNTFDNKTQCVTMDLTLFMSDGDVYKRFDEQHIQRAYTVLEITDMLSRTGFYDIKSYSFLTKHNTTSTDERIQFFALKKG